MKNMAIRYAFYFLSLCLLIAPLSVHAKTIHVSQKVIMDSKIELQVTSITEAAKQVEAGDTVLIHSGIYREKVTVEKNGTKEKPIIFKAAPGAFVVVTGADRLKDWTSESGEDNIFSTAWPYVFVSWNPNNTHPDDDYHLLIGRCEQVFINHYAMRQVLARKQLARGTFFADTDNHRLYVWATNNADLIKEKTLVEASVRDQLWINKGNYIRINGIRFRYAANRAQQGAVSFEGDNDAVLNCVFEYTNSSGAVFTGKNILVRNCIFQNNGQLGFGANRAHGLYFTGCTVQNNNIKGFSRGWEAGGDKIVLTRNAIFEKSKFIENRGNGIWFDIGNEDCTVQNCLIANNEDAGIFYEISYSLHAHDNVVMGNGFANSPGAWGANGGITLSSSPNCVIERNLIVGNKEGFQFREQTRSTPQIDDRKGHPVWNHDQVIQNNIYAYNRDAQVWGWFDMNDQRMWPKSQQEKKTEQQGEAGQDIAKNYKDNNKSAKPTATSLEELKLTMGNNVFCPGMGQELFHWGVTWKKNRSYSSIEEIQNDLGLEQGSEKSQIHFQDIYSMDLRIPSNSTEKTKEAYPQGEIPGVRIGLQ